MLPRDAIDRFGEDRLCNDSVGRGVAQFLTGDHIGRVVHAGDHPAITADSPASNTGLEARRLRAFEWRR